jgi:hypothetical protein
MNSWYAKLLASIANGLIFPFLLYRFKVMPWSDPFLFFNAGLVSFAVSSLVYRYRPPREDSSTIRTLVIYFVISFVVLCVVIVIYFLLLELMRWIIESAAK